MNEQNADERPDLTHDTSPPMSNLARYALVAFVALMVGGALGFYVKQFTGGFIEIAKVARFGSGDKPSIYEIGPALRAAGIGYRCIPDAPAYHIDTHRKDSDRATAIIERVSQANGILVISEGPSLDDRPSRGSLFPYGY